MCHTEQHHVLNRDGEGTISQSGLDFERVLARESPRTSLLSVTTIPTTCGRGCVLYFNCDDDVSYYIRWRLKLEGETENMGVCTKERKGVTAAVLMATACTNSPSRRWCISDDDDVMMMFISDKIKKNTGRKL